MNSPASLTGAYIAGRQQIAMLPQRRSPNGKAITVLGAREKMCIRDRELQGLGITALV